ncbi:Pkinase-domain-containing protein [Polyporus arcularius HHB13444]|uniref:Pkinase-domain-containing protein n=1 Tax=Polyporus arcularius HHB13444 TaxID=1314778 RepID=A0A5C3PIJ2_9APHY|nr:Pkinase-domain-containing protein [Polyporus arcularius HHB13444]
MAVAVASSTTLQALEDASQPTSRASSPTSPSSVQFQTPSAPRSINLNGSLTNTPTSAHPNHALEPPPGVSYPDFLRSWTDAHIALWLADIKCGHQAATFRANDIRSDVLLELDQATLKEMGITSVGDRLRILNAVKQLRQKCSSNSALSSILNRPRGAEHNRTSSLSSDHGGTRTGARRLESGRPAPLHLPPNGGSPDLPRLVRDGQDSARLNATMRPLPAQPNSATTQHGTPTTAHSRANLPPLPPPPRGQPPLPPIARTPRNVHNVPSTPGTSGRRTPTLPDAPLSLPQAGLLTPSTQTQGNWSGGYGLPSDPRQGNNLRTPSRSTSPLPFPPSQPPVRGASRAASELSSHTRTNSNTTPTTDKPLPRPGGRGNAHPYATSQLQQAHGLSPIAESFMSQRTNGSMNPSPPTYRGLSVPFRPGTPQNNPSLDDLKRKLMKFTLPDDNKTTTLNVADCNNSVDVLTKALKKFGKLGADGSKNIESDDTGLSVDGWGAFLDWGQGDATRGPLSDVELMAIVQAPPDDPAREHGLTLLRVGRFRRVITPPTPTLNVSDDGEDALDSALAAEPPLVYTKAMKRASSISILSGLGVKIPEKGAEGPPSPTSQEESGSPTKSAKKTPSKLRNFFGQRPPSELITTHLAEYFPFTEKKVLERTRRQSMMRQSGVPNRRDSIISFTVPQSRFSVSTIGSGRTPSPRASMASTTSMTAVDRASPEPDRLTDGSTLNEPPRLSLSTDDGHSVDLATDDLTPSKSTTSPHLLPPVVFPSDSLSESLNLSESQTNARASRRMSTASKRMSYITELRSKRDRSDTASLMTVDEITAEVESRQEIGAQSGDSDEWTKVDMDDRQSIRDVAPEEEEDEEDEEEYEDEEEEEEVEEVDVETPTDDDEPSKAIMSRGEKAIKWIKGALIGAGAFGKVYLGMDAATGLLMAVKQVELPTGSAPNEERKKAMLIALEHEIELLRDLQHENIVQYHSSCIDDDHLNIFLEYVPGGSVTSLLRSYGAFEERLVRNWVRQLLLGLNYLHERDIIHRDIKGANMLVDNKGGIKISDFGISKKVEDNLMTGNRAHRPSLQGSVFWMAPEVVQQKAYTFKADIWSVGCLVVEMLTGEHPWPHLSQMQAIFKVGSARAKPAIPPDISPEAVSFLELTFELDHELRPSAADLLKHPWIANQPSAFGQ